MPDRRVLALGGALVALVLALTACGGGDKDDGARSGLSPAATCFGNAIAEPGLPPDFPVPAAVTFTATAKAGPSTIVDGFATRGVAGLFGQWKDMIGLAHYTVVSTDDEAPDDAEINYASADGTSSGQIALRDECGGNGRIAVHITNRPT